MAKNDTDNSNDTTDDSGEHAVPAERTPRHLIFATRFGKQAQRLEDYFENLLERWQLTDIVVDAKSASVALRGMQEQLEALGEDWEPPVGERRARTSKVKEGVTVRIKDKFRETFYEDAIEPENMDNLVVLKVTAKMVQCKDNLAEDEDSRPITLMKNHVEIQAAS